MPATTDKLATRTAVDPDDPRGDPWLIPDRLGRAIHEVIADIAGHDAACTDRQIVEAVSRALERRSTAGPALRRRLTAMATTYYEQLAPPSTARFVGAEVELDDVRFDLLWTTGTHVWVDELKSVGDRLTERLVGQCERQLKAGILCWGTCFLGVRIVWLQTPGRQLLVTRMPTGQA